MKPTRRRRIRRELVALGFPRHEPTDATRMQVRLLVFNKTPHEIIAAALAIDPTVLSYWYARELEFTETEILAQAAANMLELAAQRIDLGVAYRANETLLKTRLAAWREPRPLDAEKPVEEKPTKQLTLQQVEDELSRLNDARSKDGAAAAREDPLPGQAKPH